MKAFWSRRLTLADRITAPPALSEALREFVSQLYADVDDVNPPEFQRVDGDLEFTHEAAPSTRLRLVRDIDNFTFVQCWTTDPETTGSVLRADWPVNLHDPVTSARTIWHLLEQLTFSSEPIPPPTTRSNDKKDANAMTDNAYDDASPEFRSGLKTRRSVMGEQFVDDVLGRTAHTDSAALQQFITEHIWHGVWNRPGLSRRDRSLLNLGILTTLRAHDELSGHVRGALNNGLYKEEIIEAVVHTAAYCGAPAAVAAMKHVQRVLDTD